MIDVAWLGFGSAFVCGRFVFGDGGVLVDRARQLRGWR
jgi:hypothetical protein